MKIELHIDQTEAAELADRAKRLKPAGPPSRLDAQTNAIQFLRGVGSRATMSLPAFYLFLGSNVDAPGACSIQAYPGTVFTHWARFSTINTLTLACRKVFDHSADRMRGATFAKLPDTQLEAVAAHWANHSQRRTDESLKALDLLREVFRQCSKPSNVLLDTAQPTLCKRIGLLKQHANNSAAHLSLEHYEFSLLDCAHFVSALTLIGEIIRTFDDPLAGNEYYNGIDEASLAAAKVVFPKTPDLRLFRNLSISDHAASCWRFDRDTGLQMLLEQLPYAISWF